MHVSIKKYLLFVGLITILEVVAIYSVNGTIGGQPENDFGSKTFTLSLAVSGNILSLVLLVLSARAKALKYIVFSLIIVAISCITTFCAYFIVALF